MAKSMKKKLLRFLKLYEKWQDVGVGVFIQLNTIHYITPSADISRQDIVCLYVFICREINK